VEVSCAEYNGDIFNVSPMMAERKDMNAIFCFIG
jgi:hypothetical protein